MAMGGREVILAAAQAALDEARTPRRRRSRLPAARAILLGAGAVTAWRVVARSRGREVLGALEDRLLEYEERHFSAVEGDEHLADDAEWAESDADEPDEHEEDEAEDEDAADDGEDEDEADDGDDEDEADDGEDEDEESSRSASAGRSG